jgi:sugar phosphate isomerase/epimerase
MDRRHFLASLAATPLLAAKPWSLDRISFITDEVSASPEEAIAFAHKYGLKWVELRGVPSAQGYRHYEKLTPIELGQAAKQLREAGLKVSFFNASGIKTAIPGVAPARVPKSADWRERAQIAFDGRMDNLRVAIAAAQAFDADKVRVFTFARVAEPEKLFPRIAEILGEMGDLASKEGVRLLIENEAACNVGTCAEMAALIKLLPEKTFGLNWDANNGQTSQERPYPEGYALLPKNRIQNVHMHGRTLLDPEKKLDWAAIFAALDRDGYKGRAGLETHYFDGTKIEKSHLCLEQLRAITSAS